MHATPLTIIYYQELRSFVFIRLFKHHSARYGHLVTIKQVIIVLRNPSNTIKKNLSKHIKY